MICPYCNEEMRKGYIKSYKDALKWYPDTPNENGLFARSKEGVKLTSFWTGSSATVHRCEKCKKLIIDESDLDV
ncbi:MAG: hypothetical protein IJW93_05475 [Clostridia bacterium]|nr:hypothetical protein [Clostridia bacterium]